MTIQPISAASVALYLTPADLRERGVCADELTAEHTLELTREAFRQVGLPLEGALEIEIYPDQCGLLVFVHLSPERQTVWRFEDCEALFAAAAALSEDKTDGALYWWKDCCWLVLPGGEAGICARLSEFGSQETGDPYIFARLKEYGTPLLTADAPSVLRRYFG
ncbi:MAG: hypothetical protein ACI4O3_06820 [Oscillospiraceae bacterium]